MQIVAVGQEKDAVVAKDVSANQFPDELEDGERLARAGGHQQQNARNTQRETEQRLVNGHFLIGPNLLARDLVNVPRMIEGSLPARPINRVAKAIQNVAGRGWRGRSDVFAGLAIHQNVFVPI